MTFFSAVYWGKQIEGLEHQTEVEPLFAHLPLLLSGRVSGVKNDLAVDQHLRPLSGVSRKLMHRSSVVLPLPEEPMMETTCPCSSEKLIPFSTSVLPKDLQIFLTSRIGHSVHLLSGNNPAFFSSRPSSSVTTPVNSR